MSLYRHNVGWSGESFSKGGGDKKMVGADLYDDNDFDDEESGNPLGDISLAPSKIQRVATYPTADTNTGTGNRFLDRYFTGTQQDSTGGNLSHS